MKLLSELLSLAHDTLDLVFEGSHLVAALGHDVGVVRRATAVPGQELVTRVSER